MVDLLASAPIPDLETSIGEVRLSAPDLGSLTWIAPWPGEAAALATALETELPAPGRSVTYGLGRLLWAGRAQYLLVGGEVLPAASTHGAVTDVTDVWTCLRIEGRDAEAVLARLIPIDLRSGSFAVGATARTLLGHMAVQILAREEGGFDLLVMRSFVKTAEHELVRAMRLLAGRRTLEKATT